MASVSLTRMWVNRVDSGEAVSAYSIDRSRTHGIAGEVRAYAGGRQRSIAVEGERGEWSFTLRRLTLADIDTLRAWEGVLVQVRDHRGQREFGVIYDVPQVEYVHDAARYDVGLTLRMVTAAEGV
ncbi:hypothetical protein ACWD6N_03455 [Micromonospora sp. NPDC005163]